MSCTKVPNTIWTQFESHLVNIEDKLQKTLDSSVSKATENNTNLVTNAMTQIGVMGSMAIDKSDRRHEELKSSIVALHEDILAIRRILEAHAPNDVLKEVSPILASLVEHVSQIKDSHDQMFSEVYSVSDEIVGIRESLAQFFESPVYEELVRMTSTPTRISCEGLWAFAGISLAIATWAGTIAATWMIRSYPWTNKEHGDL